MLWPMCLATGPSGNTRVCSERETCADCSILMNVYLSVWPLLPVEKYTTSVIWFGPWISGLCLLFSEMYLTQMWWKLCRAWIDNKSYANAQETWVCAARQYKQELTKHNKSKKQNICDVASLNPRPCRATAQTPITSVQDISASIHKRNLILSHILTQRFVH